MGEPRRATGARLRPLVVLLALGAGAAAGPAQGGETLAGPIAARVLRVVDGDTLDVRATIWLGQEVSVLVRVAGIDAPELRARCPAEAVLAEASRARAVALIGADEPRVDLIDVTRGKFAGRVVARVRLPGGGDLGAALMAEGLARPYDGRGRRPGWCG